jgi:hypothetical protein
MPSSSIPRRELRVDLLLPCRRRRRRDHERESERPALRLLLRSLSAVGRSRVPTSGYDLRQSASASFSRVWYAVSLYYPCGGWSSHAVAER